MPLDRRQAQACIDILVPHFNTTPDDRRAFLTRALYGEKVLENISCTGRARTFATNLVRQLDLYDETASLIIVLETLQQDVGEVTASSITRLIADLSSEADVLPDSAPGASTGGRVFISYAHADDIFVQRLRDEFDAHNIPYWIDDQNLMPGTPNWERSIRAAIRDSRAVVWVASPNAYASVHVDSEVAVAGLYERPIFPVWAAGENWIDCVPMERYRVQYVDMRGAAYAAGVVQLVAALRGEHTLEPLHTSQRAAITANPKNPYKGLKAFQEEDSARFFGREKLVARLAKKLETQLAEGQARFLAVLGPSGAGKSSVVLAGLLPALRPGDKDNQELVDGSKDWTYLPHIVPGNHPVEHLADALKARMPAVPLSTIQTDLNAPDGRMLDRLVRQLPGERVVLYIDQFEETFGPDVDEGEKQQFISLLTDAAVRPDGKLIVLLSMRADFLGRALSYGVLGNLLNAHNEMVLPMSIAELQAAIENPAQLPGFTLNFEPKLVREIIFALRERDTALAGALPLLQFTLDRLYAKREGACLTWDAYEAMGRLEGAIGTHSEEVFCALPEAAREKLGKVFLPLVNIDEDTAEPTRRRASRAILSADPDAKALIDAFIDQRLLQTGDEGGEPYLEITHEALFHRWDRLAQWLTETRDDLRLLREVRKAARDWDRRGRELDYLWNLWVKERGREVQAMLQRLQPDDLSELERAFSRPEAEQLVGEIVDDHMPHARRSEIGARLHALHYTLAGAGLRENGPREAPVPDIAWCYVDAAAELHGQAVAFEDDCGQVYSRVPMPPFYIARYPITQVQFQAFLDDPNGFYNPDWWADFPESCRQHDIANACQLLTNYPRDGVSWYHAVAFARWFSHEQGYTVTLPTEQQWQWAAQNGLERREYPWEGSTWDDRRCNTTRARLGQSMAVGMYPRGVAACGASDMSGNLWEWCLNKAAAPDVTAIDDSNDRRVLRGGAYNSPPSSSRSFHRNWNNPDILVNSYGFRLVCMHPHLD